MAILQQLGMKGPAAAPPPPPSAAPPMPKVVRDISNVDFIDSLGLSNITDMLTMSAIGLLATAIVLAFTFYLMRKAYGDTEEKKVTYFKTEAYCFDMKKRRTLAKGDIPYLDNQIDGLRKALDTCRGNHA
jgi:hypothetical protein